MVKTMGSERKGFRPENREKNYDKRISQIEEYLENVGDKIGKVAEDNDNFRFLLNNLRHLSGEMKRANDTFQQMQTHLGFMNEFLKSKELVPEYNEFVKSKIPAKDVVGDPPAPPEEDKKEE